MSAIFGIYYRDGRAVSPRLLERMSDILDHRGGDGDAIWHDGPIGFGHRMLWTTPESINERLPLSIAAGGLAITADARIDNRDDLLAELGRESAVETSLSDSEIILRAYEKWGADCTSKLLGDFAFAIWDKRSERLFCARDHFGVKPFYYYSSEDLFVFATEIKALHLVPGVPAELNEARVYNHLRTAMEDKQCTFYKDIFRLQPAWAVTIDRGGKRIGPYWELELHDEIRLRSDGDYAEALREHFSAAVDRRLRGHGGIGSMLSGGIDSSSIPCMARKLLADKGRAGELHTFSSVFDEVKECDEREFMNTVLRDNNLTPHFTSGDKYGPFVDYDKLLEFHDEPMYGSNMYLNWLTYKKAKASGVRVILDGFDGDSTISHGLGYFNELVNEGRWFRLTYEVAALAGKREVPRHSAVWAWLWFRGINPWIARSAFRSRVRSGFRRAKGLVIPGPRTRVDNGRSRNLDLLNPHFKERMSFLDGTNGTSKQKPASEREAHLTKLLQPGNVFNVEMLNRLAGAMSVDVRFPFWDKRLIEFCLGIPPEQKIRNGWTRLVMRHAMEGILPPEIQWRPGKTNMSPSFNYGLLKYGREFIEDVISKRSDALSEFVNIDALKASYQRFINSEADELDIFAIQRSVPLALWLRRKVD